MIYHVSIPAERPEHVARVLGELIGGPVMQFVPGPDSFVVFSRYGSGTTLEIVPRALRHLPGGAEGAGNGYELAPDAGEQGRPYSAVHVAMASPRTTDEILAIAGREGWRALHCWRATAFALVEVWIENAFLVEFFPPDLQGPIAKFMGSPETWREYFGLADVDGIARLPRPESPA